MNLTVWALAGGLVGWAFFAWLKFNATRGLTISVVIGMAAGLFGAEVLAPMLGVIMVNPGEFHPLSLFMALVSAMACLTIGNMIHNRFGV